MHGYAEILVTIPLLLVCFQLYSFAVTGKGREMQGRCLKLGVAFMVIGIGVLVFRSTLFVFFGLILMLLGFRLLAHGLDRLDKKIYIDRLDDDQ